MDNKTIKKLILSNKVDYNRAQAFSGCTNLEKVSRNQKSRLKRIKKYAFKNCTSLKTFNLFEVRSIHKSAFKGCKKFNVSKNKTNKSVYKALPKCSW